MQKLITSIVIMFISGAVYCQSEPRAFLSDALERTGPWKDLQTISYKTSGQNYNKWQNFQFNNPIPTIDEAIRSFDFAEKVYYSKTISRYGGGYVFEFVNIGKDTTRYVYDVLKTRTGLLLQKGGKKVFDAGFSWLNESFPHYAINSLLQTTDSLAITGTNTITRFSKDGSKEVSTFDNDKNLLSVKRIFNGQNTEKRFSAFKNKNGLVYPEEVAGYTNDELVRIDRIVSFETGNKFDRALLTIPAEYKLNSNPPSPISASQIAKDVYMIEKVAGDRNVLFVNMDDYIITTESPVSVAVSKSIINLIHQTIPGKPIKYMHLSHFHNDHSSGINAYLAEGATILSTQPTIDAIRSIVADSLKNTYAKGQSFSKEFILKDAHHEVRFYEIKNSHALGLSFMYLPNEGIIYEGDLYSLPEDGTVTPAIEITKDFYRFTRDRKLKVNRIIGHHGAGMITMDILKKAVMMK